MKMAKYLWIITALILFGTAVGEDYTKYERSDNANPLLKLSVGRKTWTVTTFPGEDQPEISIYPISEIGHSNNQVTIGGNLNIVINDEGIRIGKDFTPAADLSNVVIESETSSGETSILFATRASEGVSLRFKKRSDRISFSTPLAVEEGEFVRGSVIAFFGDIDVFGEVNGDVVSFSGNVHIYTGAVVRGDVIALNGVVKVDSKASIYGMVKSAKAKGSSWRYRSRRWRAAQGPLEIIGDIYYNRVDGAAVFGGIKYTDADSLIPSIEALAGYAFSSSRWRYNISLTQTVLRGRWPLEAGGRIYRLLSSDDDQIISNVENSIFALFFNEDWKDYYETQGAYGFLRAGIMRWGKLEIGYQAETQNWLDAHPKLWALFGSKEFRGNFSSVPYNTLIAKRADFADRQMTSLKMKLSIDSRNDGDETKKGWYGYMDFEHSPQAWKGDFDFDRFETRLQRYQPLNRYQSLLLTAAYGQVNGDYIPLNRFFFLGGLGTVHGCRHKETVGKEYVLFSGEYHFRIPRSSFSPFLQFDCGKISPERLSGNNPWLNSLSIGLAIEDNLKIFVSQRLDKGDHDPIIYARFMAAKF